MSGGACSAAETDGEDGNLAFAQLQGLLDGRIAGVVPAVGQHDDAEQLARRRRRRAPGRGPAAGAGR